MTRGLAEMRRLGIALGAEEHTFSGLAGLGDLVVTCSSKHSRNRFVGEQIGRGKKLSEILHGMKSIAEGVATAESAKNLAELRINRNAHRAGNVQNSFRTQKSPRGHERSHEPRHEGGALVTLNKS